MTVNTTREGEKLIIKAEGNLGTATAEDFDTAVKKDITGVKELVFDFEKVGYMASAGLRVVMSSAKAMKRQKGSLKLINVPGQVMDVFKMTGVADVLDITPL